jgi:hypothetical protein
MILRHLYRLAIRLHPSSFRERFGGEMLYIFDQQNRTPDAFRFVLDSVFSLFRQWLVRPNFEVGESGVAAAQAVPDGIPSFLSLTSFRPRTAAVVHGMALSLILFCLTSFAIPYSWIRVLHVHIPEVSFDPQEDARPAASPNPSTSAVPRQIPEARAYIVLDSYVGKYISGSPRVEISIEIDGDHLSLRVPGHPRLALSPVSRKRFLLAGTGNGWIDFTPDQQGLSWVEGSRVIVAQRQ